jgi:hypothetical protein
MASGMRAAAGGHRGGQGVDFKPRIDVQAGTGGLVH